MQALPTEAVSTAAASGFLHRIVFILYKVGFAFWTRLDPLVTEVDLCQTQLELFDLWGRKDAYAQAEFPLPNSLALDPFSIIPRALDPFLLAAYRVACKLRHSCN